MIRRLLNLLMAALLIMAGPSAAWAALVPTEPSCCGGPVCPCPPPPRPAPQFPGNPAPATAPSQVQVQAQAKARPRGPEPQPWILPMEGKEALASEPLPAADVPDPPNATERQSRLGLFRK